ncbi:MAG: Na+/H+ antiporter subunit E [Thermoplasmata archaeon]|nr:Na+/H+ antiporter subunit E [Thermoplasmata archaeon]
MKAFAATAVVSFLLYLLLTAGSGDVGLVIGLWSVEEIAAGAVIALIVGVATRKMFCSSGDMRMANPVRWFTFLVYLIYPFFFSMAKANLDVAYRVITGKIRPGIVKIESGLEKDLAVLTLANSITLTPGTLTVDVDEETNDLYVHWINVALGEEEKEYADASKVCGSFPKWARRIAE